MIIPIIHGLSKNVASTVNVSGENGKILEIENFTAGKITIFASVGQTKWQPCKFKDESDMIIVPDTTKELLHFTLPADNYFIKADGVDVNSGVIIRLS